MFTTRAFHVLKLYPTPNTVFILPMLPLPDVCFYRTTHDLGLGLPLLLLHPELVLLLPTGQWPCRDGCVKSFSCAAMGVVAVFGARVALSGSECRARGFQWLGVARQRLSVAWSGAPSSSSNNTITTPHQHDAAAVATQSSEGQSAWALACSPLLRIARIKQIVLIYLYRPRATWNEVGLCLLREMLKCVSITLKRVAGTLFVKRRTVVCPSLQCGVVVVLCCVMLCCVVY